MQLTIGSYGGRRQVQGLVMGLVIVAVVWEVASWVIAGSDRTLLAFGLGLVVCALVVYILKDWRTGVFAFLVWLLFEDLARKYLGNSMVVYFAKDFLLGIVYISFDSAKRRGEIATFEIPFRTPLLIFLIFASIQIFNVNSPSIFYGFLGLKLYFYYVPLAFLGYAMVQRPKDLERLLTITVLAGIVIAVLGVAQSVLGIEFLTPNDVSPELYDLTHVTRFSPVTHQMSVATSSVFVSAGRFSFYLIFLWIIAMGAQGYLLLIRHRGAIYGFLGIGVVTAAVMVSGTRTPFIFVVGSGLMMSAAFLWGAPWRWGQGHRLVTAIRRVFFIGAVGVILLAEVFPTALGGRWAFVSETLFPSDAGPTSDLAVRGWDYPVQNLRAALGQEHWLAGVGTGTVSLGSQYVARFFNATLLQAGGENGFATITTEMGVFGLGLWIVWVTALLWSGWRVVKQLRQTVYFPIGFAIWWYCLVTLVLLFYLTAAAYQNFVNGAYMWLLVGVLYGLPRLAQMPAPVPIPRHLRAVPRWRLALIGR
jgi:hypothetical protein